MLQGFSAMSGMRGGGPVKLLNRSSIITRTADLSDNVSHTFTAVPIGAASSTRRVIVCLQADDDIGNAASYSDNLFTIGGITATRDVFLRDNMSSGTILSMIYSATVPTGTTADIVVRFQSSSGNGTTRCAIVAAAVDGLENTAPISTGSDKTLSTSTYSATVNWKNGGYVIALGTSNYGGSTATLTGVTEREQINYEQTDFSWGDLLPTSDGSAQAVTCVWGDVPQRGGIVVASYR